MSVLIVIPARFASSRYPGKPLVELRGAGGEGRSLIARSHDAATRVTGSDRVVVATDHESIATHCRAFGAEVVMTSADCRNGTERCAEAHGILGRHHDVVVNLQGDAPLTPPWFIDALIECLLSSDTQVATPVLPTDGRSLNGFLHDRRIGLVGGTTAVFGAEGRALYFSKEVIPYTGQSYADQELTPIFHHVGVYAYRPDALEAYRAAPLGRLERLEGLEQLRFLELGIPVRCIEVDARGRKFWELNNPQDVPRLESMMAEMGIA